MITATTPELIAFVAGVQAMQNNWQEGELVGNPNFFTTMQIEVGPKNIRVVKAENGTAMDPAFRKWLEHQVIYHGEKDRPYAAFLLSLLK